jgi:hypothetical protein
MLKSLVSLSFFTLITFVSTGLAQDNVDAMKSWVEYMTPGKAHEMMASMTGDWNESTKYWLAPDSKPQSSEGSATFQMILGGRYMQGKHTGQMMGKPFDGMSLDAYDNGKKEHISIWIDNMGTGVIVTHGAYNEKSKVLTMTGTMYDPMQKIDIPTRDEISWDGNDKMIHKMYTIMNGKEFENLEITLTRKK